jgi:hypothetical protein
MNKNEQLISDIASEALRKWGLIKHTGATDEHLLELFRMVARESSEKVLRERDELLEACEGLSNMYAQTWDRADGALAMLGSGVDRFEKAHAKANAVLAKIK